MKNGLDFFKEDLIRWGNKPLLVSFLIDCLRVITVPQEEIDGVNRGWQEGLPFEGGMGSTEAFIQLIESLKQEEKVICG